MAVQIKVIKKLIPLNRLSTIVFVQVHLLMLVTMTTAQASIQLNSIQMLASIRRHLFCYVLFVWGGGGFTHARMRSKTSNTPLLATILNLKTCTKGICCRVWPICSAISNAMLVVMVTADGSTTTNLLPQFPNWRRKKKSNCFSSLNSLFYKEQ